MSPAGGALNSIVMRHNNRLASSLAAAGVAALLVAPIAGRADSWAFPAEKSEKVHAFGSIQIVFTLDARQNQRYPLAWVDVLNKGTLLARYPGFPSDAVHASQDSRYFLLLSNTGLTNLAYAVLDHEGRLLASAPHGRELKYCAESVSLLREWYDRDNPSVRFETSQLKFETEDPPLTILEAVKVRGCSGKEVTIRVSRQ